MRELEGKNILVTGSSSSIDAGITDGLRPEYKAEIVNSIPLGRLGKTEEVGEMIAFLASDRASYISRQLFAVNDGLIM